MERSLLVDGLAFPESPRWHEGALWLSDIARKEVVRVSLEGRVETVCRVAGAPSGLGWLPDGRLLIVSMHARRLVCHAGDRLSTYADLSSMVTADVNDMVVDGLGRAYVTNFGYDAAAGAAPVSTGMVLVRPDGSPELQAGELFRPNGCAITPDGRTLLVAETRLHRLSAFTIGEDGTLADQREFASLPSGSWADGICLDAEGAAWVGDPKARRCVRVREGGMIADVIDTSPLPTIACVLGGPQRRTLFLTLAPLRPFTEAAADPRGRVETVKVAVPGAGLP
jgi:sugar lactone lactonase YvrE